MKGTLRLLEWAQVPLSISEWKAKEKQHTQLCTNSQPLPGVEDLLTTLSTRTETPIVMALASSAGRPLFQLKTSHIPAISSAFTEPSFLVFGDDPEISDSKKKPNPDIFLLTLKRINDKLQAEGQPALKPEECLVLEDSIAGVEAARRANMRVVWVPHPGLAAVCRGREMDVLMGRMEKNGQLPIFEDVIEESVSNPEDRRTVSLVSEDGWAEMLPSLEAFSYEKYGILMQR